ncbi:MAG: DUF2459 domain-containing protein [Planctomycetota bacterium]|jgi:hypothetical protein
MTAANKTPCCNKRKVVLSLFAVAALFWFVGCTSVITAPESPADPVEVYFLMDNIHRGLWLPDPATGDYWEYGYGDWDWYAMNHDRWYHTFDTSLWPTQGTLGRRVDSATNAAAISARYPWMQLYRIRVSRAKAELLHAELESVFAEGRESQIYNSRYRMSFVHYSDSYWFLHNCNDEVADWLVQLGCHVSWVPIRLDLEMASQG